MNQNFLEILSQTIQNQFIFRALGIFVFSFIFGFFANKFFLAFINKRQICRQPIRASGPATHLIEKKNTPTMGGLMIILTTISTAFFFIDLKNSYILIIFFAFLTFGIIGFIDDYMKVTGRSSKGFKGAVKLVIQFVIVGIILIWLQNVDSTYSLTSITAPFSTHHLNLGAFYILFATVVVVGTGNATNLTDGLDGLVSVPAVINLFSMVIIIMIVSNYEAATKLHILHIKNTEELVMFCVALSGAILAFLMYNLKPAKIFMGDVGSLAIGASLGTMAIILKQELVFAIISLLFVIEAASVILQVGSYKLRQKRIFLMAPLHHHFEKLGWGEKKVVRSFWLASLIFSLIGISGLILNNLW